MSEHTIKTIDDLRDLLKVRGLERLIPHAEKLVAPSIRLILEPIASAWDKSFYPNDETAVGCSKVGGLPDLPPDFLWPETDEGAVPFLAQFRLEEIADYDLNNDLPHSGLLTFFFNNDDYTFPEGCCQVFHFKDAGNLERRMFPDNIRRFDYPNMNVHTLEQLHLDLPFQAPMLVRFWNQLNAADNETLEYKKIAEELQISDVERDIWWQLSLDWNLQNARDAYLQIAKRNLQYQEEPMHQLLGLPYCGNYDGREEIAGDNWQTEAAHWRLLLQLSSDDNLNWGDAGKVSFFIRRDNLQNGNFAEIRVSCDD